MEFSFRPTLVAQSLHVHTQMQHIDVLKEFRLHAWWFLHYILPLDSIQRSELNKRDGKIAELTEMFTTEHESRVKAEQERDQLKQALVGDVIAWIIG